MDKTPTLDEHLRKAAEGKSGIFRDHRCWKCNDGEKPCVEGAVNRCGYPKARND
jgi:hypothetical protein